MRSSSSTPQVYQRAPTEHRPRLQNCHKKADKERGIADPARHDRSQTPGPHRAPAPHDGDARPARARRGPHQARHRGHRSGHRRHRAVGQAWATGSPRSPTSRPSTIGPRMAPGETYARLDEYQAAKQVLVDRRPITVRADRPEDDPAERAWLDRYGLSAALLLPLVSRGDSVGLMYLARREGAFSQDDLVYSQLLSDIAGSAIENAQAVRRAPVDAHAVPLADRAAPRRDLPRRPRDRRDAVREPADHRAVRHHPGRVEGEPGLLAAGRPSGRPRACPGGVRGGERERRAVPRRVPRRRRGRRRALGGRPHRDPAGRRRPADPDPGNDLRHHGPEARRAGALATARTTIR